MDPVLPHILAMTTLIVATRNRHKVEEIRAIWDVPAQWLTLNEYPAAPTLVEDADTFAGNADRKATQLADWLCLQAPAAEPRYVLADDSGLEVVSGLEAGQMIVHEGKEKLSDNSIIAF